MKNTSAPLPAPPTRTDAVRAAVDRSQRRRGVPLRNVFVQSNGGPGPLASIVRGGQHAALDLFLTLMLIGTSPRNRHEVTEPSRVWARLIGLDENSSGMSSQMSRLWATLEGHGLIERERRGRNLTIRPLMEDGSGRDYSRPASSFLRLPLEYFVDGWYEELELPGKAMLLVSLTQRSRFELTLDRVPRWYGFSTDTAQRGMSQLTELGLISSSEHYEPAPLSPTGYRAVRTWTIHGAARKYVAPARNPSRQ